MSVQADKSDVFSKAFDNNSDTCGSMKESHGTRMYVQTESNSSETMRSVLFNVTYKENALLFDKGNHLYFLSMLNKREID